MCTVAVRHTVTFVSQNQKEAVLCNLDNMALESHLALSVYLVHLFRKRVSTRYTFEILRTLKVY